LQGEGKAQLAEERSDKRAEIITKQTHIIQIRMGRG
jgi:hypothetical protein